jgi:hypothetical protein
VLPVASYVDFGGHGERKFSANGFWQLTDINEK